VKMNELTYKTKTEIAFLSLREMIFSGELQPGKAYSVLEFADKLNISRTPLAKAIDRLQSLGFVELTPKAGFMVRAVTFDEIEEHYYLLTEITKFVVKRVIERSSNEQIDSLTPLVDQINKALDAKNEEAYFTTTKEFFLRLCEISNSSRSYKILNQAWDFEGWYTYDFNNKLDDLRKITKDHAKLIALMKKRDVSKALSQSDAHTQACIDMVRRNYEYTKLSDKSADISDAN